MSSFVMVRWLAHPVDIVAVMRITKACASFLLWHFLVWSFMIIALLVVGDTAKITHHPSHDMSFSPVIELSIICKNHFHDSPNEIVTNNRIKVLQITE